MINMNGLNPSIIMHGTKKEDLKIEPIIRDNSLQIIIYIPEGYNYNCFKFVPKGNSFIILFENVEIYTYELGNLFICPDTITAKYNKNGHMIYIEGKLFPYSFTIKI